MPQRPAFRTRWLLAGTIAAVAVALVPLGLAGRLGDVLAVDETDQPAPRPAAAPPLTYIVADRLYRPDGERRLAASLLASLLGTNAFLAVGSPRGDAVVYHAWRAAPGGGRPVLRIHHLPRGRDRVLAEGAQSVAWRSDGTLAYLQALRPDYRNTVAGTVGGRIGHVVVRRSPTAPARRWTRQPSEYRALAWARTTLLVRVRPPYVFRGAQPTAGVYALDEPGWLRPLPISDLTALSPDGRRAVGAWRPGDSPSPVLRLVDIASARILSETTIEPNALEGPGDWRGDTVVGVSTVTSANELAVLETRGNRLEVRRTLRLDEGAGLPGYEGASFSLPLFVDGDDVVVRVTTLEHDDRWTARMLSCSLTRLACRGATPLVGTRWAAVVANPSRP